MKAYDIPDSLDGEIGALESLVAAFVENAVSESELKAQLASFGVYEQRTKGTYMIRIRCTAGIITPSQLKRVSELSIRFASGTLHITTRQEIQIHNVTIGGLIPVIRALACAGLSTRGGGGNTVRNIIVPWDSGISQTETFDVTPYAVALASRLIARPDSWCLPRKFKIAFANSETDLGLALVNDVGFVPVVRNGIRGFRVYVAGGLGRQSQVGQLFHDFIKDLDAFFVAEAIKRVFSAFGDRSNRNVARLRFLWNSLGKDAFVELYQKERTAVTAGGHAPLEVTESADARDVSRLSDERENKSDEFLQWTSRYVTPQKQTGFSSVTIPFPHGVLSADAAMEIARTAAAFGDDTIRFTVDQNIALRNIPHNAVGLFFPVSKRVAELSCNPAIIGRAVACTGAGICRLGICRSPDALDAIRQRLLDAGIDLDAALYVKLHVSGCPNACGQHLVADIGLCGKLLRQGDKTILAYSVFAGADINNAEQPVLAGVMGEISARDLPRLIVDVLRKFLETRPRPVSFAQWVRTGGEREIRALCTASGHGNITGTEG